jgi:glycerol dehydrogenase
MNDAPHTASEKVPGQTLKMVAAFPGKYIQGEGALSELPRWIEQLGGNGLLVASPTAKNKILPGYFPDTSDFPFFTEEFAGECCGKEISRLEGIVKSMQARVIIGMGGGKTIDTAKIVADRAGLPVIIVPTIASTDAPCSGCAVIYSEEGVFERVYYQKMNPQIVLVDSAVIARAPVRFLVAGMGDALATWFEARSCEETHSPNECGGYSTLSGLALAKLCFDTLLRYGSDAKVACENQTVTTALDHIIEANTLLSGIGFESSGLATAHSVHNGMSVMEATHAYFHGEKVAFGVLTGLHLTGSSEEEKETVYSFCEEIGLPTTLEEIGLAGIDETSLLKIAQKAADPAEGIHHEAVSITPLKIMEAMKAADAMGRARKDL